MDANEKNIFVYDHWSYKDPVLMGTLFVTQIRGTETYSFAYDELWLKNNATFQFLLDPHLEFYQGRQYPIDQDIFGLFSDSCPDRWG